MDSRTAVPVVRGEINITPLVDVCLVLLVIFMIVGPILAQTRSIDLPATARPLALPVANEIVISLEADGAVFIGQDWVPLEKLESYLAAVRDASHHRPIVLRADRNLPFREIKEVLALAHLAEFKTAGLITEGMPATAR
jgi:biopolymer transport protein TolR